MSSTVRPQPGLPTPQPSPAVAVPFDQSLRQRLSALRGRIRFVTSLRGVGWVVACVLGTFFAVGLIDYRMHLPPLVRAVALVSMLLGSGVLFHRLLYTPLSVPSDDLSLALRIEDRYPMLNDSLGSTVEFLRRTSIPAGESELMRRESMRRALARLGGVDFNQVVDSHGMPAAVGTAGIVAGLALIALLVWPSLALTAAARLAAPFSDTPWPGKTRIEMDTVPARIGRGKEFRVTGTLSGIVPAEAAVEIAHDGFPAQRKALTVHPENHTFSLHLRPDEVQRNFAFRVSAGDAETKRYDVEVLALPVLAALDGKPSPQVRVEVPAYTDLPTPVTLPPGTGNLDVVLGSKVQLRAATDRPLKRAWLEYQPETPGASQSVLLAPVGISHPLGALGSLVLGKVMLRPIPATLENDRRRFSVAFEPCVHGMYAIHFEDENDLESSRTYELRVRLDPAPTVRLERPAASKDTLSVLPTGRLPLRVSVEDTQYAVRSVWLELRTHPDEPPRRVVLSDPKTGIARAVAPFAGQGVLGAPAPRLRPTRLEFDRELAMKDVTHADGSPLKDGDTVLMQACADDFDDVSPSKEPGKSHVVTIRVVKRETLDAELTKDQGRVQKELVELRDKQRDALNKIKEMEARARKNEKLLPERDAAQAEAKSQKLQQEAAAEEDKADKATTAEEKQEHSEKAKNLKAEALKEESKANELKRQSQQLAEAEQLQQQLREKLGNDKEGVRAEIERIQDTLKQNGMENSNAMDRTERIKKELDRLADKELDKIEPKLNEARKIAEMEDPQTREERRAELEKRAQQEEQEARTAEQLAKRLDERAAAAEKAASEASEEREASRKTEEAQRLHKDAETQRQKAAEKRAESERDKKDAQAAPDPNRARQALADARRSQEEVERSLSNLLQDLEPWSSTLDINNEANRLAQEQRELQARAEELAQKESMSGKKREELAEQEKADLDALQDAQRRLQERTAALTQQMKKLAEQRAEKDPETANAVKKAAEQAEQNNLNESMKQAQEAIGKNQLSDAKKKQSEALAELEKMQQALKDSREERLDRLAQKMKKAEELVEKLMDDQEKLKKKIKDAQNIADPMKRQQAMQELAQEQQALAERTKKAADELARLGNDRAKEALDEAARDMNDMVKKLERGKPDEEKQEEALDRLDEARMEAQRSKKKAEEELGREQLIKVADVIRRIRERQEGHNVEAKRLQDDVLRKGWSRGSRASMNKLRDGQKGLADETMAVVKKDLSSAPIFAKLLEMAVRSMTEASERAGALGKDAPEPEKLPDADLKRLQEEALRRLDQLLASLKESADEPRPLSRGNNEGGEPEDGGDGGGGGPQGDDSLPPTAQLKLLRAMQKEVNERTEEFGRKNPDPEKLTPALKTELDRIRRDQKEVADLLDRLTTPPDEGDPDAMKEEKKEDAVKGAKDEKKKGDADKPLVPGEKK